MRFFGRVCFVYDYVFYELCNRADLGESTQTLENVGASMTFSHNSRSRRSVRLLEWAFVIAAGFSMALVVLLIAWIFVPILYYGAQVVTPSFLFESPKKG